MSKNRVGQKISPLYYIGPLGLTLLIALPILSLLLSSLSIGDWTTYLARPLVLDALRLSLTTSTLSLLVAILVGLPSALLLSRASFPGRRALDSIIEAPIILPPAVAGVALLMAFGRRGTLGPTFEPLGIQLAFSTAAVVLAQAFVATPFFVRSAKAGLGAVSREIEMAAEVDGASNWQVWTRVTLPLAFPSLLSGAVLAWARALGEFGATIMFAGSISGKTQTMPLAIYAALETDLEGAILLSTILVIVSLAILALLKWLAHLEDRVGE